MLVENNLSFIDMKGALQFLLTAVLVAFFGIANAQTTRWYGYVLGSFGGEAWQHKFISFETQAPGSVQTISETLPDIQAATYVDGYIYGFLEEEDIFNREDAAYSMGVTFVPEDGYVFAEDVTVFFNGDSAPFNADGSGFDELGNFQAGTIDYYVTDPTNVAEQTIDDLKDLEGQTVSIYDLTGRLVLRDCFNGQLSYEGLKPGLYVATVGGRLVKFVNK